MCGNGLLFGPLFIEGKLTGAKYQDLLVEQVFPALMERFADQFGDNKFMHLWWAQHGAPAHRFNPVRDILKRYVWPPPNWNESTILTGQLDQQT